MVTDDAGSPVSAYNYDAYGAVRQSAGEGKAFTYTGEQLDTETSLVFLRARTYDPQVGSFLQRDGVGATDQRGIDANKYSYADGNPIKYSDPSGRFVEEAWDVANVLLDLHEYQQDPSILNGAVLALDTASAVVPFVPALAGPALHAVKASGLAAQHVGEMVKVAKSSVDALEASARVERPCEIAAQRIYTRTEVLGRTVYRREIDWGYRDPTWGLTNLQRARMGMAPIGEDGMPINLHHLLQGEPGPMAEVLQTVHQRGSSILYGLREGESFRNEEELVKQYNRFRVQYWKLIGGDVQ